MKDEKRKPAERRSQTPVSDGDTRPDGQPDVNDQPKRKREKKSGGFTSSRMGDINSLEDYKDKKLD